MDWQPPQMMGSKSFESTIFVSANTEGKKEPVTITLEINVETRPENKPGSKGAKRAPAPESTPKAAEADISVMPILKTMETHIDKFAKEVAEAWAAHERERNRAEDIQRRAKDDKSKNRPSAEDQTWANEFLAKPEPQQVQNNRVTVKKFMDAAALALRQNGQVEVLDAWDVPVIQIELKFQSCKPEDLFKHFAPK
ncbi:MAG: hypothetical protein FJ279_04470 [Planctomycetes bacterium]|nr:hypothetical protein [Planctomycetota bacterium]